MGNPRQERICKGCSGGITGLSIQADDAETERYGKTVSDLQSAISVGNGKITGTLKYVTGYTGWTSEVEKQSGNFLALKLDVADGAEVSAMLGDKGPVDLTEDKYLVARISDKTEKLKFTATKGGATEVKEYDLSELVLEEEG